MGSGSSRNQVTPPAAAAAASNRSPPSTPAYDDVVITRSRPPPPLRQQTIEKTVTETGAEVGKLRPVLRVSDSEDNELEDIEELEQTFDSLGIPANPNRNSDIGSINRQQYTSERHSELEKLRTRWEEEPVEGSVGWAIRSTSGPHRLDFPQPIVLNNNDSSNNFNNTKSAPTKFSWAPKESPVEADEWIYKKSTVEGFDPEKFKRINHRDSSSEDERSTTSSVPSAPSRADDVMVLHPHSIPDYDVSEQQILESIEKEFVS